MGGRLKHFALIVAGENPEEMVKRYDSQIEVEKYVVYEIAKAKELHEKYIKYFEEASKHNETFKDHLDYLQSIDDIDFYCDLTEGYDLDDETGNAVSTKNPDGKYYTCKIGKDLVMPLITTDGKETFSDKKGNINWKLVHLGNHETYERVWDMVMNGSKPQNDIEQHMYDNMKARKTYFEFFGDKDTYVINNTAFWGFAFLSKETGWLELDEITSQIEWVSNFFDRFIKDLPDETLISVFECTRIDE